MYLLDDTLQDMLTPFTADRAHNLCKVYRDSSTPSNQLEQQMLATSPPAGTDPSPECQGRYSLQSMPDTVVLKYCLLA